MAAYTAIDDPQAYFQLQLYTGTGSSNAITLDGDTALSPNLVWIKNRSSVYDHHVYDTLRGVQKAINTNTTEGNTTKTTGLTAFGSDGFTVGADAGVNNSSDLIIAHCWKESAVSGFDIVEYSGTGSATTFAHSLSAVPHFILIKQHNTTRDWAVYHHKNTAAPETDFLRLTSDNATADSAAYWNDTAPTSSVFSVGTQADTNDSGGTLVAYLFSEKQGFSKFGVYTANGNADGPFVYTGFRPALVTLIKSTTASKNWAGYDDKRGGYNSNNHIQLTDQNSGENASVNGVDLFSNGFKCISTQEATNDGTGTYVYAAFAHSPFVNSNGVPNNAR